MATTFRIDGLAELKAEMRDLPEALRDAAVAIIDGTADAAAEDIRNAYPEGETGNLKKGVRVRQQVQPSPFGYSVAVISAAQHANIFEYGAATRKTNKGWNRGSMPAGNVFIPRMAKHRRRMWERFRVLLEQAGLRVTDDGGS
jgi:hypothetical protein